MSLTLFGNSGKAATIELEKEIEVSSTKAAMVTLELVFEAKAKTSVKILVGGNVVDEINPGEAALGADESLSFEVAAGQKYEVKKATGLKEALASVALEQQSVVPADVEALLQQGLEAKEEASVNANEELRQKNARILS